MNLSIWHILGIIATVVVVTIVIGVLFLAYWIGLLGDDDDRR